MDKIEASHLCMTCLMFESYFHMLEAPFSSKLTPPPPPVTPLSYTLYLYMMYLKHCSTCLIKWGGGGLESPPYSNVYLKYYTYFCQM